jgi:hypothetical protein
MLPAKLRYDLFENLSVKTMRYVSAVPARSATGLVAEVYDMIAKDFFLNGSLTSRSKVPNLLAAIWSGGRETVLVSDQLDRTTKEALTATLSSINDCPYCGDMMVSLVHAGEQHDAAEQILSESEQNITDPLLRERLLWVRAVATPGATRPQKTPFSEAELPEAIGSLMALSDINRFSHIVMDGSPVKAPFGLQWIKVAALRLFGGELRATHVRPLEPGRTLHMLPRADLPDDMHWAKSNPRIARTVAQWCAVVEKEAEDVVSDSVQQLVHDNLFNWQGELMPMSRNWVEKEIGDLAGEDRAIARLALVLARAPYQTDDQMVEDVIGDDQNEERFLRILAWSSFTAARHVARRIAEQSIKHLDKAA